MSSSRHQRSKAAAKKEEQLKDPESNLTFDITYDAPPERPEGEDEEGEDDNRPFVLYCSKCNLIVGDSLSWDRADEERDQVILTRLSRNAVVGTEVSQHQCDHRSSCSSVQIFCGGCQTAIGVMYVSTPKNLDYKRFKFCLNVANIESYTLGSAQQLAAVGSTAEPLPILSNRRTVEEQMGQMKTLLLALAKRVGEMEAEMK